MPRSFCFGRDGPTKAAGELLFEHMGKPAAEAQETCHQLSCRGGEEASLVTPASDLGLDQLLTEDLLGFFDSPPDVAVTFPEVAGRLFERTGALHGFQNFRKAEAERVPAPALDPDLDPRDQRPLPLSTLGRKT
jgi:hypothetical protein